MKLSRRKQFGLGVLTLFIIFVLSLSYFDYQIQKKISDKRFLAPTRYFASPTKFYLGQVRGPNSLQSYFLNHQYRQRPFGSPLKEGDFSMGDSNQCSQFQTQLNQVFTCVLFRNRHSKKLNLIHINELDEIVGIYSGSPLRSQAFAQGEAEEFAQYLGNKATLQQKVSLIDIPRYCLDAVVAIEDPLFLEHQGISPRGLLRALIANIKNVRYSQGGSTITQQLVKNYFLTPEKTITRKIKEIIISLIFEFRVSKDQILETYLNIIYLGQSGVFEVRGYGSASQYYFQKDIESLNLSECALLAAIVNNPGRYNPVRKPEKAKKRRTRVLDKMLEQGKISEEEYQAAQTQALPKKLKTRLAASAPYYIDAVNKTLKDLGIQDRSGLNIFTALDPKAQNLAEEAVTQSLKIFEEHYPFVKKIKTEKGLPLQALLLGSNPLTGEIVSIVGGRNFRTSPFNRAIESRRQVGSVFKPLVYLSALAHPDQQGEMRGPLTSLSNQPYQLEYDNQIWEPKNYSGKFSPQVPLFYALKESMNIPTARLAMDVGLQPIIDTARSLGVSSPLKAYPSLSLGAFELQPKEVLQVYNTISQFGKKHSLQVVKLVSNQRGDLLYTHDSQSEQVGDEVDYAVLVGMMKETLISGTGASARQRGFDHIAAGKTGTTSDTRDAWFAGFTPFHTAVVWVGYDNGTPHNLTGASGALPIWTRYMKNLSKNYSNKDFHFPDSVEQKTIDSSELMKRGVPEEKTKNTEIFFKK